MFALIVYECHTPMNRFDWIVVKFAEFSSQFNSKLNNKVEKVSV